MAAMGRMAAVTAGMTPETATAEVAVTGALRGGASQARERAAGAATSPGAIATIATIAPIAETGEIAATGGEAIGSIATAGVIGDTGDADVAAGVREAVGAVATSRRCPTHPLS
jgi:hypothetical protein